MISLRFLSKISCSCLRRAASSASASFASWISLCSMSLRTFFSHLPISRLIRRKRASTSLVCFFVFFLSSISFLKYSFSALFGLAGILVESWAFKYSVYFSSTRTNSIGPLTKSPYVKISSSHEERSLGLYDFVAFLYTFEFSVASRDNRFDVRM